MNKNRAFAIMSAWKATARADGRRESDDWDDMVAALNYLRKYGSPSKPAKSPVPPRDMIGGGGVVFADEQPMASRKVQRKLAKMLATRIADADT